MREREGGPGAGGVSPHGVEQRGGGALLQAFREKVAGQRLLGHEPVQVRMRERERTVGTGKGGQRLGPLPVAASKAAAASSNPTVMMAASRAALLGRCL